MKKLLSILLLALLIFNMIGFSIYSLLNTNCFDEQPSVTGKSDIILKIPFSLPYVTDWQGTENVDGQFPYDDNYYNIVSQKAVNDTLYIQGEYNESAHDHFWGLASSFNEHVKSAGNSKNTTGKMIKNLVKEYMSTDRRLTFYILEWLTPEVYPGIDITVQPYISGISTPPPNFS